MNSITQVIYNLVNCLPAEFKQPPGFFRIFSAEKLLFELDGKSIKLCGEDIDQKVSAQKDKHSFSLLEEEWRNFLKELGSSYIRLNHVGISYACNNIEQEISYYKKLVFRHGSGLYEELSSIRHERWVFIGDTSDWQAPLFEIVLTEGRVNAENNWRPHFQIDIDTSLAEAQLDILLRKYFGPRFTKWKLAFPGYGTVLSIGLLGIVEGTKIYLGTGTSLRNTEFHRRQELKRI